MRYCISHVGTMIERRWMCSRGALGAVMLLVTLVLTTLKRYYLKRVFEWR